MSVSLRLSEEELELIQAYAKLKKQSVSEVIRRAIIEQIENEYDLKNYKKAMDEFRLNPKTYTQDEVEKELGLK